MKKLLFASLFILLFTTSTYSQTKLTYGIKTGLSTAHVKADRFNSSKNNSSYFFGGYTELKFTNSFSLQTEVLYYKHKTSAFVTNNIQRTYNYNYLKFPVLAKWNLTETFSLEFGPSIDYFLGQSGSIKYEDPEKYNITGVLGTSYKLTEKLFLNVNYTKDFSNSILSNRNSSLNGFSFGVGFKL